MEFGTAPADEAHLAKLTALYATPLAGCVDPALLEPAGFFSHYQLMRNLWQIADSDTAELIFLLPRANQAIWHDAEAFRLRVTDPLRCRVSVVAIEDVLSRLIGDTTCPQSLRVYGERLHAKYVPWLSICSGVRHSG